MDVQDVVERGKLRMFFVAIGFTFLVSVLGACGIGENSQTTEDGTSPTTLAPSPQESDSYKPNKYTYSYLCIVPDELYGIRNDAKLIDDGLLLPVDVEQDLRILGTQMIQNAESIAPNWTTEGANPDPELLNDYRKLGEKVLQFRLDLLSGKNLLLLEIVDEVDDLNVRSEKFCEWVDKE